MIFQLFKLAKFAPAVRARVGAAKNERGATAVEYGLLIALIAAIIIATVATLGTEILNAFQTVVDELGGAGGGGEGE